MQPVMNNLIKEWRSKLSFLSEELKYMFIKLQRADSEISTPEKHNQYYLFKERVHNTLKEIEWKAEKLETCKVSELERINFERSLQRYEEIKQQFEALMNDDILFEVA